MAGVELVPESIADAKVNAELNGITNVSFTAGDMKKIFDPAFVAKHGKPDVVITDPPRAGMDEPVVRHLLELDPPVIVYVSCNPATQARDLALMNEKYRCIVQPIDMFPHTYHVENVVRLVRRLITEERTACMRWRSLNSNRRWTQMNADKCKVVPTNELE